MTSGLLSAIALLQISARTKARVFTGRSPQQVIVDLGYRGVDQDNPTVEIIHRGKYKSLTQQQRRWLKRRQAVEPAIGHLKSDHRMDRCWLKGQLGDALHAVLCAAGYNLRWLMRAMVRLGQKAAFLRPLMLALMRFLYGHYSRANSSYRNFRPAKLLAHRALPGQAALIFRKK